MGLFGTMDIDDVPTDPNFVKAGYYSAFVSREEIITRRDGSQALRLTCIIQEPESRYHGFYPQKWFNLHEDFDSSQDEETAQIIQDNARLKRALLALGVTKEQMSQMAMDDIVNQEIIHKQPCVILVNNWEDTSNPDSKEKRSGIYDIFPPSREYTSPSE